MLLLVGCNQNTSCNPHRAAQSLPGPPGSSSLFLFLLAATSLASWGQPWGQAGLGTWGQSPPPREISRCLATRWLCLGAQCLESACTDVFFVFGKTGTPWSTSWVGAPLRCYSRVLHSLNLIFAALVCASRVGERSLYIRIISCISMSHVLTVQRSLCGKKLRRKYDGLVVYCVV